MFLAVISVHFERFQDDLQLGVSELGDASLRGDTHLVTRQCTQYQAQSVAKPITYRQHSESSSGVTRQSVRL